MNCPQPFPSFLSNYFNKRWKIPAHTWCGNGEGRLSGPNSHTKEAAESCSWDGSNQNDRARQLQARQECKSGFKAQERDSFSVVSKGKWSSVRRQTTLSLCCAWWITMKRFLPAAGGWWYMLHCPPGWFDRDASANRLRDHPARGSFRDYLKIPLLWISGVKAWFSSTVTGTHFSSWW